MSFNIKLKSTELKCRHCSGKQGDDPIFSTISQEVHKKSNKDLTHNLKDASTELLHVKEIWLVIDSI